MDSFEWNKVAAAVISGLLLIMLIRTVSNDIVYTTEAPEEPAYRVAVATESSSEDAEPEDTGPTLPQLLASADPARGERTFRQCTACHSIEQGGPNKTGPNLYNVVGASVAHKDDFNYSSALANYDGNWTYEFLDAWLENPKAAIEGNKMTYAGLKDAEKRAEVIVYLASYTDNPPAMPEPAAAADAAMDEAGMEETGMQDMAPAEDGDGGEQPGR